MAREERLIQERTNSEYLPYPMASTNHIVHIKDTVIKAMRDMFSRDPDFAYITTPDGMLPDFDNPKLGIVIIDVFNYEVEFLPAVTVKIDNSKLVPVGFNQNEFTYDYAMDKDGHCVRDALGRPIPIYKEYAGMYESSITLNVHTWDPLSREELVTRIAFMFEHQIRDQLYADCGLFVQSVSVGGEAESAYSNDYVFSQSIALSVLTQWTNRIPVGKDLLAINLQIIGDAVTARDPHDPTKAHPYLVTPSKQELEESDRIDWVTEIKAVPDLLLTDALRYDTVRADFFVTQDWVDILLNLGVNISDAIIQINSDSSLKEKLLRLTSVYKHRASVARSTTSAAFRSGSSGSPKYRFNDGTIVFADSSVLFTNGVKVLADNTIILNNGIKIFTDNRVYIPNNDNFGASGSSIVSYLDLERWVNPFTATNLNDLTAFNFFLVLLYVDSVARQSVWGLSKLITDYLNTLTEVVQIDKMSQIKTDINALTQYRILHGHIFHVEIPS